MTVTEISNGVIRGNLIHRLLFCVIKQRIYMKREGHIQKMMDNRWPQKNILQKS